MIVNFQLPTLDKMQAFAKAIAPALVAPCVVYLQGDLGVGKTTLVRYVLNALGHAQHVKSPTYTIVEPYLINMLKVFHFDLYRLTDPEELEYLGVQDYFEPDSICFIEWPDKGKGWLPSADITIELNHAHDCRLTVDEEKQPQLAAVLKDFKR
jgi:tRNA threonylcarbamoyladenosine biosynthesis protein TsaE